MADSMDPGQFVKTDAPSFYKELLDNLSDGVYFVDRERRILYWNEGACRLTGYKADEMIGRFCHDNVLCHVDYAGRALCENDCPLTATISDGAMHEARVFLRHKQGRRVPVLTRVQPIRNEQNGIVGAIEIFSDDSAQTATLRKAEALERLAFLDHLTQLPNRRYMEMSLRTSWMEYREHKDPFGLVMIDLDNFKTINDDFGHNCGDRALQEVAKTLVGAVRGADIVGRWGGDEFLAIVGNVKMEILHELANRCVVLVQETSIGSNNGEAISLSVSVGAALIRPDETVEELIGRADRHMYRSKTTGRNRATVE
jgi:diguanylate cyclase (GGDEF)-like protein/PAS domain S-box-containing protein